MISRREFFKYSVLAGTAAVAGAGLAGCGEGRGAQASSSAGAGEGASGASASAASSAASASAAGSAAGPAASPSASAPAAASGSIVVFFSHAGENYGVGHVEEGNTAVIAKMIAEDTGADLFEVVPSEAYPEGYDECCDVALAEQNEGARPAFEGDVDLASYKTVYLGYPIWWGDLPMCLYTFLEAHDWSGKEVRPFCTHAGSGLAGTAASVGSACPGASVGQGLSIEGTTAQNSRDAARSAVEAWLG